MHPLTPERLPSALRGASLRPAGQFRQQCFLPAKAMGRVTGPGVIRQVLYHGGPQRVAFDITQHDQRTSIILNQRTLETALPDMADARVAAVVTSSVRDRQRLYNTNVTDKKGTGIAPRVIPDELMGSVGASPLFDMTDKNGTGTERPASFPMN